MFLHLSVSHSVHRWGCLPQCMMGYIPQEAADTPLEADTPPPEADTPSVQCMLGDTGNKRAIRILLECILVVIKLRDFLKSVIVVKFCHFFYEKKLSI